VFDKYRIPAMARIVLVSISPILLELVRERKRRKLAPAAGPAAQDEPVAASAAGGRHRKD